MDLVTVLVGLGICVVTAGVLYFISVNSFKVFELTFYSNGLGMLTTVVSLLLQGKSFEEALAEQQKFANSLLTKSEKVKEKEKKAKKAIKKVNKEKTSSVTAASSSDEKPHVEFEPDAEIIPDSDSVSDKEKKKSDKKDKVN